MNSTVTTSPLGGNEEGLRTSCLLTSTYFGPVQWYQKLNRFEHVWVESMDHFQKQTFRNRCVIASPGGPLALTVPVVHDEPKILMRDLRISDHGQWRRLHWNALQTAYGESPFFEYYADDLHPFFEKKWEFLLDFNMEITRLMCQWLDIHPTLHITESYQGARGKKHGARGKEQGARDYSAETVDYVADFREVIRPKHPQPDADFMPKSYYQVYQSKYGFLPNLSILDLLFNEGNESIFFL
ncbi:MAG: WbqC family protein [Prevotella sp.]|nr:WbqC family protein [Prevotella sp.]